MIVVQDAKSIHSNARAGLTSCDHSPGLIRVEAVSKMATDGIQRTASLITLMSTPEIGTQFECTLYYKAYGKLLIDDVEPTEEPDQMTENVEIVDSCCCADCVVDCEDQLCVSLPLRYSS